MLPCASLADLPEASAPRAGHPSADIWWWPYRTQDDWNRIRQTLAVDEQTRADRFHFSKDATAFMAGRYLQRTVLSAYSAIPAPALIIATGTNGKPYLADQAGGENITFNLSNTDGLAVFIISRNCSAVGIDVETRSALLEPQTADLFCSPAELETLSTLQGPERQSLLLAYWTLKESFLKATGHGLTVAPHSLNVRLDPMTKAISVDSALAADGADWHHRLLHSASNHLIAISTRSDRADLMLRQHRLPDPH
ncbi:4'-phosphopantetheinyl transferase superfamily protein (plasmid) [Phyllobacterium sp. 628]|uniref:4'-phosphopantetheinyl transferase family protein n=1 Tax=Phyllobacterium sp. 628 TaxID=2718938 RepID=UPI0016622757|nr:4'-phosphopantetheinyl transferase superfamily protein [Phyllobacterium sp. 628]QND50604.1 4'-phosphopantetheinyl transferase superfamily protein [Phyllobacterium sp. 628]